jgi:hypothetical protein
MPGESEVIFRRFVSRLSEGESVDTGHGEESPTATILTAPDRAFFVENGYLALPAAVPEENLAAAIRAICEFLRVDRDDPLTWYRFDLGANGVVPLHQHQAFWDNRQHFGVYQIFSELLGWRELWVTMDRASFKPPHRADRSDRRDDSPMHWDRDPLDRRGAYLQGLLYLTDTAADQGAFQCVPKIYRSPEHWNSKRGADGFLVPEKFDAAEIATVPGRAGTLVVWDSRLPHGNGLNHARLPRFTQYLAMQPAGGEKARRERVRLWRDKRAPSCWRPWPRQIDPEPGAPAKLTPLGRKLLGIDRW